MAFNIKNKFILLLLASCLTTGLQAQQDLSLHFMEHIWQANQTNPAIMSDRMVTVNIASPYINVYNSGFSFNDIFQEIAGTDSLRLTLGDAIDKMKDQNSLQTQINVDVLSLGLRFGKIQVGASYAIKGSAYSRYQKSMLDLAWNGNAAYVGETVNIAPDFQAYAYNEIALGGAYKIDDKLSIGARVKFLSGIADMSSNRSNNEISVTTDAADYAVTLNTDYYYQGSGFPEIQETFDSISSDFQVERLFAGNFGMAFDFGATYQFNKKLSFAAGINDLGFINWSKNVNNYKSVGSYTYDGIELGPLLEGDSISFQAIADTLKEIFNIEQAQQAKPYKTKQAAKIYLSARFKIMESLTVGGLFYNEIYRGRVVPGLAVSISKDVGKLMSLGAVYSYRNKDFTNLGVNATFRLGPIHLFMLTDNVVTMFRPYDSKNFNLRFGLNVAVGKIKTD